MSPGAGRAARKRAIYRRTGHDLRPQETRCGVLGDRGAGRGAGGVSGEHRAGVLVGQSYAAAAATSSVVDVLQHPTLIRLTRLIQWTRRTSLSQPRTACGMIASVATAALFGRSWCLGRYAQQSGPTSGGINPW